MTAISKAPSNTPIDIGVTKKSFDSINGRMPFLLQVSTMTWRYLIITLRNPGEVIPGILISIFFLVIYSSILGDGAAFIVPGKSYLAFILPVSVISSALSGAGIAGQALVRDIGTGYFDKLLLTPASRWALLLGAMIAGAIVLAMQTVLVVLVGLLLGLTSATGVGGLLVVVAIALLLGIGFAGFTVGIALRSGSAGATQGSSFLFFPLTFLTATFVPLSLLKGWLKIAATFNPVTYMLEGMRSVLLDGWASGPILAAIGGCLVLMVVTFIFALTSLAYRTRQK